ncbi:MAG: ATP-binding protein [Phycisphaerales bacterium]|nr:ATP-binding protein [Phycisphaerales bacterium]
MLQDPYRYQVVLGPRRVGKTVALYQTIDQLIQKGVSPSRLWFLRLDHPLLMHFELGAWARSLIKNFNGTLESPLYLFLDEVNYSTNWDKWLKTFYDEKWPLRIVATSSSTAARRNRTVESGVGRWSEQFLMPYLYSEYLGLRHADFQQFQAEESLFHTIHKLIDAKPNHMGNGGRRLDLFLLLGGFPELLAAFDEKESFENALFRSQQVLRSEAVQRVAGMDIPQAFDIKNPFELERLLYVLAGQMCGLMNVSNLAGTISVSRSTAHQYIHYLEQAYLIFTLPNYSTSEESVQRKGRKVFFVDGAVRNAALQRGLSPMTDSTEQGHLRENAAASHLYTLSIQAGQRLYHWRDGKHEVDLVYEDVGGPIAFEISGKDHHRRGLRTLLEQYPAFRNRCFVVSSESPLFENPSDENEGIGRLPLASFLIAVGAQTKRSLRNRLGISP